jgi:hypothetical protein
VNEDQLREQRVQAAISQGRALVRDARLLVERTRRRFADLGIDPEAEYEALKAEGGEAAVVKAQAEFQGLLDEIDEEMKRDALHAKATALVPLRRRLKRV